MSDFPNITPDLVEPDLRQVIRTKISDQTERDSMSFIGSLADVSGLLVAIQLADVVALSKSSNFEEYKTLKMKILSDLSPDNDVAKISEEYLKSVQNGSFVLTASLKGVDNVLKEALIDSTKVASVLIEASKE